MTAKHQGTIGILTSEQGRFSRFWGSLHGLRVPGLTKTIIKFSLDVAEARNQLIEEADGDWLWMIDDDHVFEPLTVMRLLRWDVDIVAPVVLSRYEPFAPVHMGCRSWTPRPLPQSWGPPRQPRSKGLAAG